MAKSLFRAAVDPIIGMFRRKVAPTDVGGVSGVQVYGGFVTSQEKDPDLVGSERRFRTFDEMLLNRSIIAAGVRYSQNLVSAAKWKVDPAGTKGKAKQRAEFVEDVMDDMATPWHRVVRKGSLYRYLGNSIHEWVAKKRDDGLVGFADLEHRPQFTVWQWDIDEQGILYGINQRSPLNGVLHYIPREKFVYLVDDSIASHPEGVGLLRHCVDAATRLHRFEQLEAFGFDTDLRGIPIARVPILEMKKLVTAGVMTAAQAKGIITQMTTFIENRVKTPSLGLVIDSAVYTTKDGPQTPSPQKLFDFETVQNSSSSQKEVNTAIDRLNHEIARILGVEELMLGGGGARGGSQALAKNKSQQLAMIIDGTLREMRETFQRDLLEPLWALNGFDKEDMPELKTESVQLRDVEEITQALLNLAQAGQPLAPDDPVGDDVREILHLSGRPELVDAYDATLRSDRGYAPEVAGALRRPPSGGPAPAPASPEPGAGRKAPEPQDAVDPGRAAQRAPKGKVAA